MKKQTEKLLSQTFEEYAEREIPANLDLWSAIQQELGHAQSDELTRPLNLSTSKNNSISNKESAKMLYPKRQSWALGGLALVAIVAVFLVTLSVWLNNDISGSLANQPTPTKFAVPTVTPTVANSLLTPTVGNLILTPEPSVPVQATLTLPTVTINNVSTSIPTTSASTVNTTVAGPTATTPAKPTMAAATPTNAVQNGVPTINPATPTPAWTGNIETVPHIYAVRYEDPGKKWYVSGISLPVKTVINIYADAIPPYDTKPLTSFTTDAKGEFAGFFEFPNYNFPPDVLYIDSKLRAKAVNSDVQIVTFAPVMLLSPNYKNTASLKASSTQAIAQKVVLSGSGYPANTELQVVGEIVLPNDYLGTVVTDKQGNFTVEIELTPERVKEGSYTIRVKTANLPYESFVSFGSVTIQPSPTPTPKPAFTPTAAPQQSLPAGVVTAKPATPTPMPVFNPTLPVIYVEGARGSITLGSGLYFSVNGDRFPANSAVNIFVDAVPPYDTKPLTSFTTDANGRFSGFLIFPDYSFPTGVMFIDPKIRATPANNPELKIYNASTTFLVSPAYTNTAVLKASSSEAKSQKVILTGSGYPPNVEMPIYGGVQNPGDYYGTVTSDAQGNFAVQIELKSPPAGATMSYYYINILSHKHPYGASVTFGKP